jgi:hypothetical protein
MTDWGLSLPVISPKISFRRTGPNAKRATGRGYAVISGVGHDDQVSLVA